MEETLGSFLMADEKAERGQVCRQTGRWRGVPRPPGLSTGGVMVMPAVHPFAGKHLLSTSSCRFRAKCRDTAGTGQSRPL